MTELEHRLVSEHTLIRRLSDAISDTNARSELGSFVTDLYVGEYEYVFDPPELENVFVALSPFFESLSDREPDFNRRLKRALQLLKRGLKSPEWLVLAIYYGEIEELKKKLADGKIPRSVFLDQIQKLGPRLNTSVSPLVEAIEQNPEWLDV